MTTLLVLALSLPQLLLVTVGIFAVLFGLAGALYAYALFRALSLLLKQRFRFSREQRIEFADVPAHLPAAYATTVTALEALGFTPLGWSTSERSPLFDDIPLTKCWLEHRDEAAYASVSFWASGMSPVVALTTFAVDAGGVFTMNGLRHTVLWEPKGVTFEDPYAPSLAAHWQAHVAAVRAAQLVVARLDFDAMLARVDGIDWGMNASAARPGAIADDRGILRLTFGGAIAALRNLLAASKRARIATAAARRAQTSSPTAPPSTPAIAVPLPIEEEAAQLDRSLAHERAPMHLGIQLALLLPALATLFAVALLAGSPLGAVLILVALALHELGYYIALRLLGDTDTPRTWLPLIRHTRHVGKDPLSPTRRILALLAGPVPSLLLAIVLALAIDDPPRWLSHALLAIAGISLLSLMPTEPFTGGQILRAAFGNRTRWLSSATLALIGLALLLAGLFESSTAVQVPLFIAAAISVLLLPRSIRLNRVRESLARARRITPPLTRRDELALFVRILRERGQSGFSLAHKAAIAKNLTLGEPAETPTAAATLAWLVVLCACLFASGFTAVGVAYQIIGTR